jgi:hypothetical protein
VSLQSDSGRGRLQQIRPGMAENPMERPLRPQTCSAADTATDYTEYTEYTGIE